MQLLKSFRFFLMMMSLAWVLVDDKGQLSLAWARKELNLSAPDSKSLLSMNAIQKVAEMNNSFRGLASVSCVNACLKIKSQVLKQEFVLDSSDDAVRFDLVDNDVLDIELVNSKHFDSVITYGASLADFSDQSLMINWTKRDIQSIRLQTADLKYRFYKTEWRSFETKKVETAVFALDAIVIKPPEFVFHHQVAGSGIQQLLLSQTFKKVEQALIQATQPLILSRTSLIGYEFRNFDNNMKSCQYFAPNGSEENCFGWFKSRVIRSVSDQDVGVHKIQLITTQGPIVYQFQIIGLQ